MTLEALRIVLRSRYDGSMPELPDVTIYVECLNRLLADRSLSRLLKVDLPKRIENLEGR